VKQLDTHLGPITVFVEKDDGFVVSYQDANFEAMNVATKDDVIEVMLMVMGYSSLDYQEVRKARELRKAK
jgi:hypothetical protein